MGIATMQAVLVATAASAGSPGMHAYSMAFLAGAVATGLGVVATLNLEAPNRVDRVLRRRAAARGAR
jgi:hypothetical protein